MIVNYWDKKYLPQTYYPKNYWGISEEPAIPEQHFPPVSTGEKIQVVTKVKLTGIVAETYTGRLDVKVDIPLIINGVIALTDIAKLKPNFNKSSVQDEKDLQDILEPLMVI